MKRHVRNFTLALAAYLAFLAVAVADARSHSLSHGRLASVEARAAFQKDALSHHRYVCRHGRAYSRRWHCAARRWTTRELRETLAIISLRDPVTAIGIVFGPYARAAVAVASCESGSYWPARATYAANGEYLGMFQMGESERRLFGHGPSAIAQARAAFRYFVASGRDWSPWTCKPWW